MGEGNTALALAIQHPHTPISKTLSLRNGQTGALLTTLGPQVKLSTCQYIGNSHGGSIRQNHQVEIEKKRDLRIKVVEYKKDLFQNGTKCK